MVYDCTSLKSAENLASVWLPQVKLLAPANVPVLVVGNKSDLCSETTEAQKCAAVFAHEHGYHHIWTSAKTGKHVAEALVGLVRIMQNRNPEKDNQPEPAVLGATSSVVPSGCCFS